MYGLSTSPCAHTGAPCRLLWPAANLLYLLHLQFGVKVSLDNPSSIHNAGTQLCTKQLQHQEQPEVAPHTPYSSLPACCCTAPPAGHLPLQLLKSSRSCPWDAALCNQRIQGAWCRTANRGTLSRG
jgi:hypothetical protein